MTNRITADTVTDQQIRELRSALHEEGHTDTTYSSECDVALDPLSSSDYREHYERIKRTARARCAEILNARAEGK